MREPPKRVTLTLQHNQVKSKSKIKFQFQHQAYTFISISLKNIISFEKKTLCYTNTQITG